MGAACKEHKQVELVIEGVKEFVTAASGAALALDPLDFLHRYAQATHTCMTLVWQPDPNLSCSNKRREAPPCPHPTNDDLDE